MIEFYFSTVKILAQRPTHISAVATLLLITKTFMGGDLQKEQGKGKDKIKLKKTTTTTKKRKWMLN